ncbi:MAG: DUF1489 domain-containing protein [Rhodospirillales bacterium]|nr:DUF1489 domain-containing protein [Rhodospirillales bacterium]
MPLHLIKLCVGIDAVEELAALQKKRIAQQRTAGVKKPVLRHLTRNTPKRAAEILDGGSLYWVIKGVVRVRQRLVDIVPGKTKDGEPRCELRFDRKLVRVVPRRMRAFQGWRYLNAADVPPDLADMGKGAVDMPAEMAEELRALGLL